MINEARGEGMSTFYLVNPVVSNYFVIQKIQRFLDILIVLAVSVPSALTVMIIYLYYALCIKDGGAFLYTGERFGLDKKRFNILKIRTLRIGAE
ncbi:MAG: sugar transferase, partial [Desulfocurvibacter africanus]